MRATRRSVKSKPSKVALSLAYVVEAFAAREGIPPRYRRRAALQLISCPVVESLGDDRVEAAIGPALKSQCTWTALAESDDGRVIRCAIHQVLWMAKRGYDAWYNTECRKWRKKVAAWSTANQLLWGSDGRLINPGGGGVAGYGIGYQPPPRTSDDNRFPDFDAINSLASELLEHRSSSFPVNLMNHPQLFDYRSMTECGGML